MLCMDARLHEISKIQRHEQSIMHQTLLEHRSCEADDTRDPGAEPMALAALPPLLQMADNATRNLLQSMAGSIADNDTSSNSAAARRWGPVASRSPSPPFVDPVYGWGQYSMNENTELTRSAEEEGIALIAKSLLDHFDELSGDESEQERSEVDEEEAPEPIIARECTILPYLNHSDMS